MAVVLAVGLGVVPAAAYPRPGHNERISVSSDGVQADGTARDAAVSADGRYVAFSSFARNLVPGITNDREDVFVHDRVTGTTRRVSVASDGTEANHQSRSPAISADGRYVAFHSQASNLVPGPVSSSSGSNDVYVHDLWTGITERASVDNDGLVGHWGATFPSMSADGRYVAFHTLDNLVPEDTNGQFDIYVRDRQTGTTELVSVATDGTQGDGSSQQASISADGRHIAFFSRATNLVAGTTTLNTRPDIFVHDRVTGVTERVSVANDGMPDNGFATSPRISADGRFVAFRSSASNLVPVDTNKTRSDHLQGDVYVHDRHTGRTERVSVATDGAEGDQVTLPLASVGGSYPNGISADGRYVAFHSFDSNLVPDHTNDRQDIFVHDRVTGATERVSLAPDGSASDGYAWRPAMSADGRYVAFESSWATNLVQEEPAGTFPYVYLRDRGPAVGVGDVSAAADGDQVIVSGWASLTGQVLASVTDPPDDGAAGADEAGAELIGASLIYLPEGEHLLVRLGLASLPSEDCTEFTFLGLAQHGVCEDGGGAEAALALGVLHRAVLYGVGFELGGSRYEIRARAGSSLRASARLTFSFIIDEGEEVEEADEPHYAVYRCDPDCVEHAPLSGSIGTTGAEVRVLMPLAALDLGEGADLTDVRAFADREGGTLESRETLDAAALPDVSIPAATVTLGIAPAGTPESDVAFDTAAALTDGVFSGAVEIPSAGDYAVWARACLGDVCGARSVGVTR